MASAALVGCTGLVGSQILKTLLAPSDKPAPQITQLHALTRKPLPSTPTSPPTTLHVHANSDSLEWPSTLTTIHPPPSVFISALGTTRAAAGSFAAQRTIDIDLNLSLAQAAKDAGARIYVLISSAGVSSTSAMPYSKMKGELEDRVREIGFEKTVILKPGLLVGAREESRPPEAVLRWVAQGLGWISRRWLFDTWAVEGEVVGRAVVGVVRGCLEGKAPKGKVWVVGMRDIVRLGRDEWEG